MRMTLVAAYFYSSDDVKELLAYAKQVKGDRPNPRLKSSAGAS